MGKEMKEKEKEMKEAKAKAEKDAKAATQVPHCSQQHSPVQQEPQHRSRPHHAQQGYGPPQGPSFDQLDFNMPALPAYNGHAGAPLTADVDLRAAGKAVPIRGYPDSPPGNPQ